MKSADPAEETVLRVIRADRRARGRAYALAVLVVCVVVAVGYVVMWLTRPAAGG